QFGSELDADTREKLDQGERIREVLKQPQYKPMPVEYQVIIIYAVTRKYLLKIPTDRIVEFEEQFFEYMKTNYPEVPASIKDTKELSEEGENKLKKALDTFISEFK
ncbi:MAG: F0F1 ATP synthase subunit alpha, partial [Lachnospiraceae bacterium]|nr:F0F1 ATP synthase subunit alpha [Lachnospiraceae bacterium]